MADLERQFHICNAHSFKKQKKRKKKGKKKEEKEEKKKEKKRGKYIHHNINYLPPQKLLTPNCLQAM